MKKIIGLAAIVGLTVSLSGCSGASAQDTCKAYLDKFSTYLADILKSDPAADSKYASALTQLADKAPSQIKSAFLENAADVENSSAAATACAPYFKK